MKLPIAKSFKLNGRLWRQKLVSKLVDEEGCECFGLCDTEDKIVEYDAECDEEAMASTQVHEWIEAASKEKKINLTHTQIEQLEEAFYEILTTRRGKLTRPSDADPLLSSYSSVPE